MVVLCQLKELGLSCFGCCGNNYSNKKKLMRDIKGNAKELHHLNSIRTFMSRNKWLKSSGICANLVVKDGIFYCPGHPSLNGCRDYRDLDPFCNKKFICKTYSLFQAWSKEKQQEFLDFLKTKNFDSFTYSIKMDNSSILEGFNKTSNNK